MLNHQLPPPVLIGLTAAQEGSEGHQGFWTDGQQQPCSHSPDVLWRVSFQTQLCHQPRLATASAEGKEQVEDGPRGRRRKWVRDPKHNGPPGQRTPRMVDPKGEGPRLCWLQDTVLGWEHPR